MANGPVRGSGASTFLGGVGQFGDVIGDALGGLKRTSNTPDIDPSNFQLEGQERRRRSLLQQADFAAGRGAPQIAGSRFQGNQGRLVGMLERQAAGQGPSAAQGMLRDALGRNVSTQQALLATGGPGAARAASQQAGALSGSLANQAAQARVQEQLGAQGLLSQTLQGARSQDLQRQQLQSDADLRSRGLNDQQIARLRQMELDNARLGLTGSMGLESALTQRRGQDLQTPSTGEMAISGLGSLLPLLGGGV